MRTRLVVAVLVATAVLGTWAPEANAGGGYILESGISIGTDPAEPYVRFWPADEPAIAELDDAALIQPPNARSPIAAGQLHSQKALHRPDSEPDPDVETAATCSPDCGETAANSGGGRGAALGLALLGAGTLAVLWFFAVRTGPSRKRVTSGSATAEQTKWDVRSDPPKPIRL